MRKIYYPALFIVLLIGIAIFATGMTVNISECSADRWICNYFNRIEWEALCAGLFGLAGGLIVIIAARQQIETMNSHQADQVNQPLEVTLSVTKSAREQAQSLIAALTKAETSIADESNTGGKLIDLEGDIYDIAQTFMHTCDHLEKLLEYHGVKSFDFSTYNAIKLAAQKSYVVSLFGFANSVNELRSQAATIRMAAAKTNSNLETAIAALENQIAVTRERYGCG
ncbi:hypothetical protein [Thalassospira marina]|uniref:Uncharacterized protein n=1 Tax=Thalassospira marina TaxID=2048283 RepID=A0A2N3KV67_9PROT|nr:hypothetical protein [Thalassospira marina]PKR54428.1 hypothetical protein COO20_09875 [Thalassospira marina]